MKKQISSFMAAFAPPVLVLVVFGALFWGPVASYLGGAVAELESDQQVFLSTSDTPGDGFEAGDPCGFLMDYGELITYDFPSVRGQLNFEYPSISDDYKACVTSSGDFYASSSRRSKAYHGQLGEINFSWSTTSEFLPHINMETGEVTGAVKATVPPGENQWVIFDYDTSLCKTCSPDDRVTVDLETGEFSGYAWSPYLDETYNNGYVSFNGVTMELPPRQVNAYVDVLSLDGELPGEVTRDTAPMADGLEYYRVRVQFQDVNTGEFLTELDIASLSLILTETLESNVYLNQILNEGEAIVTSGYSQFVDSCVEEEDYCVMIEDEDGSTSFNYFITSGAPTSNTLYVDGEVYTYNDRPGCVAPMYPDQLGGTGADCVARVDKESVYYSRADSINKYALDAVQMNVEFATSSEVNVGGDFTLVPFGALSYYLHDAEDTELTFSPRFLPTNFTVDYGGASYTAISTDEGIEMNLNVQGDIQAVSNFYSEYMSGASNPELRFVYQADLNSGSQGLTSNDTFLLLDTDDNGKPDSRTYFEKKSTASEGTFVSNLAMGYGQTAQYVSECGVKGTCEMPTNDILDPTVELWVCDKMTENTMGTIACYYGGYMDILDRHADPYNMSIVGSISSNTDATGLFSDDEATSVLGTLEVIEIRNTMYSILSRYVSGQTAGGGTITDLDRPEVTAPSVKSLMNDRLIYAQDDLTLTGDLIFVDKTVFIKGADLFINGNIGSEGGGRLGAVVLSSGGVGGSVYIGPDVTELYVNFFLDGSLFSYNGDPASIGAYGVPTFASTESRLAALRNQLYINGNVTARNTVGGAADSTAGPWYLADGTSTSTYATAREYDLNMLRTYSLCYAVDSVTGSIDGTLEECNEGEEMSTYGADNANYSPLIVEYGPPTNLPGFVTEGLFH